MRALLLFAMGLVSASVALGQNTSTYLLAWSGPDNTKKCNDALVVLDATTTSPSFGSVVAASFIPKKGVEPHHVGVSADGTTLGAGGIQAFLEDNPAIYLFNISDPRAPKYLKSVKPQKAAVPDSFFPISAALGGGFLVTLMGGKNGKGSGRILKLDSNYNKVAEFPQHTESIPGKFNPHGIAVDVSRKRIVTADYLDLSSTLYKYGAKPGSKSALRTTFRVWSFVGNFTELSLLHTFDAGPLNSAGFMMAGLVRSTGVAVVSSGKGTLYGVDLSNPSLDITKPVYVAGNDTSSCVFSFFQGGTRALITLLGLNLVQLVDTTDPWKWSMLQEYSLPTGSSPHAVVITPTGSLAAVSLYYWDQKNNGKRYGTLDYPGSKEIAFFDIAADGNSFSLRSMTDFKTAVNTYLGHGKCGEWRPHGMAWKSILV